jgi:hypothetical protein
MMLMDCAALVTRLHIVPAASGNSGNAPRAKTARSAPRERFRIVHQGRDRAWGCVAKQRDDRAWSWRTKLEMQNSTCVERQKEARICIGMQDGIPDDQRSRRLSSARRTQALRTRHHRCDPLHQGDRKMALPAARTRPLGAVRTGAPGRHADRGAAAGRRRQPGRASGLESARIRLGPGIDERGQRARARALATR